MITFSLTKQMEDAVSLPDCYFELIPVYIGVSTVVKKGQILLAVSYDQVVYDLQKS